MLLFLFTVQIKRIISQQIQRLPNKIISKVPNIKQKNFKYKKYSIGIETKITNKL